LQPTVDAPQLLLAFARAKQTHLVVALHKEMLRRGICVDKALMTRTLNAVHKMIDAVPTSHAVM
jgi:pentatricopeptide repeat protein